MKNGVECYKDFFPYFKALKTNCDMQARISFEGVFEILRYWSRCNFFCPFFLERNIILRFVDSKFTENESFLDNSIYILI